MAIIRSLRNEQLLNELSNQSLVKQAEDRLTGVIRLAVREGSIVRQVLVPEYISYSQLDRQQDTDVPTKVIDVEPNSPAAVPVGFGTTPSNIWLSAKRVKATFNRIQTVQGEYDVELLMTWELDLQQVFADNMAKDILAREDGGFFNAVNQVLGTVDTQSAVIPGHFPYVTINGGYSREGLQEMLNVMPKSIYRLPPVTAVVNTVTANRMMSLGRDEIGGDKAQALIVKGFSEWEWGGLNWIATTKYHIVPHDSVYLFSDPRTIGKFLILTDTTTHLRTEGPRLKFYSYETIASVIGNAAGLARVNFA
ncbi:MAG: hypothetical protein QW303_00425 [Nitrososphaerota archaeon]